MIIWINGAFGAGKTTVATELNQRISNSYVFDPEYTGYFLREVLPEDLQKADFQDLELWRDFNYKILFFMAKNYRNPIIVPMTLVNGEYFERIVGKLRRDGIDLKHFTLAASRETILKRLEMRGEDENSWAAGKINRCLEELSHKRFEKVIHTDELKVADIVNTIMKSIKS